MSDAELSELKSRLAAHSDRHSGILEWRYLSTETKTEPQLAAEVSCTDELLRLHIEYRQKPYFSARMDVINQLFDAGGHCRGDTFGYYSNQLLTPVHELVLEHRYRGVLALALNGIDGLIELTLGYLAGTFLAEADIQPILESLFILSPFEFDEHYRHHAVERLLLPHTKRIEQRHVIALKSKYPSMSALINRSESMLADIERSEQIMAGFMGAFGATGGGRLVRAVSDVEADAAAATTTVAASTHTKSATPKFVRFGPKPTALDPTNSDGLDAAGSVFEVHPLIINKELWSVRNPTKGLIFPPELASFCDSFAGAFKRSAAGRTKLSWMLDRGSAEVTILFPPPPSPPPTTTTAAAPTAATGALTDSSTSSAACDSDVSRTKTLLVSASQLLVLLAFNRYRHPSLTELLSATGFVHDSISSPLIGLILSGVLTKSPAQHKFEFTDRFAINCKFPITEKRKRVLIKDSKLTVKIRVPESYSFRVDKALINSMKLSRSQMDDDLVNDALTKLKSLFHSFDAKLGRDFVFARVSKLCDMGYFEYDKQRKHLLHYSA